MGHAMGGWTGEGLVHPEESCGFKGSGFAQSGHRVSAPRAAIATPPDCLDTSESRQAEWRNQRSKSPGCLRTGSTRNPKSRHRFGSFAKPVVVLALSLTGCGGGGGSAMPAASSQMPVSFAATTSVSPPITVMPTPTPTATAAAVWEIGPIIDGVNRSVGMPSALQDLAFDFPQPDQNVGHVHYVTFRHGSLTGKSRITLRYRIDAAPGVQILPKDYPQLTSSITLYFQRRNDNWSAQGNYQYYRWYASAQTIRPLVAGENTITVSLNDVWTPVLTGNSLVAPDAFASAKADADRVGFVFGGGDGLGHGVYATGPARFTIIGYEVQ